MRTTISLDDRLAEQVKRRAAEKGLSVSAFVAGVLSDRLMQREPAAEAPPFRLITVGGPGVQPGIDLDRPRELEVAEDRERYSGKP
jgi:hypothetical protein